MSKKKPLGIRGKIQNTKKLYIVLAALLVLALAGKIVGWPIYHWATKERIDLRITSVSRVPYVDGNDAASTVENFYRQYIDPNKPLNTNISLVDVYGSQNLEFYAKYYDHGFDPMVCSTTMPTKVITSIDYTGPTAHVIARAEYPDGSQQAIHATVVLNDEGMQIDSITCPGNKANLQPGVRL